ncbi:hypothetical protein KDA_03540 [Dictyobacter alpinus]|uniref:Glycoside hydrolase family 42 N-terminal domain-containing protein n=1 Tax=Dictyobacter alpinus TaxID=2014873 RepID=A0A402B0J9_9CHLR|nr:hypothetical protein [Dictyobacter alpinus]GCE24870.1 hypothetical protein KDA_03540 [Dictyobacter alpinus]
MFTLGVNYWPRKKAMYWWKDFERAEVEQEFAEIAALKLQVARIFLFWEDFQPAPDRISDKALTDLGTVLDVAQEVGIQVMPTFFTGHMSGANWWPEWTLLDTEGEVGHPPRLTNGEYTARMGRDPYTDPLLLDAELRLVAAVCGRYGSHPAIYSWNFSNEPDLFAIPKHINDSANWNRLLSAEVRKYSTRPVSAGMHLPLLTSNNGFQPQLLAPYDDFLSMHAYSIYYSLTEKDEPLNSDVVPLANLITEALGGKQVLFEEFGYASSPDGDVSEFIQIERAGKLKTQYLASDEAGGRYYREVLEKLARCGSIGAFGWMFSDYDPSLWEKPPFKLNVHERFFGLTRYDGTVKPSGEAMRDFAQLVAEGKLPQRTIEPLQLTPEEWYRDPQGNFDRLFQQWRGHI